MVTRSGGMPFVSGRSIKDKPLRGVREGMIPRTGLSTFFSMVST
ncbi:predicted protein [Sclerotinia sclerotiorum 1980 UF-70]|uniref:Uncharacterized protein n=1 Tax=Sclerotinia sclerotiorum (strain ATCC 18683 / 1980 / Ss-1) TaxID=665079 RepID=A7E421_SCLS1|nr:predicted protein [Sclerotinia sclerotiorum 1980 UF-70]EDN90643.1 predicted protein [Sclerotinia sclerotiorum 1980 UF-70]